MFQEPELISYHYDSTGVFHWCRARDMDKCLYSRQEIIIIIIIIIHHHQAGDGRYGPQ